MKMLSKKGQVLLALILLLSACAPESSAQIRLSSFELQPSVEVKFQVSVPGEIPTDTGVIFVLLDAVTGLEANPQYFEMEEGEEGLFSFTLSVPPGSLIHYRFARQGQMLVDEANASGEAIAYRLYLVDGPDHISQDFIAAWEDRLPEVFTGRLLGSIVDSESGLPLSGLHVSAGGLHTHTNAEGQFLLPELPQGRHSLLAYSEDGRILPFQQGAIIAAEADTPAELQLRSSEMVQVSFSVELPEDSVPGTPVYMAGNLPQFAEAGALSQLPDGRYSISLELPANSDIRYKYTLGDGYWNGELSPDGGFLLRQLILPIGADSIEVEDEISSWVVESSAAIWFDLVAENSDGRSAYIQFKLADWTPALAMWPLGGGHFAYKLYNPTNFASPLEYRYCLDSACAQPEQGSEGRFAGGTLDSVQILEDQVQGWGE